MHACHAPSLVGLLARSHSCPTGSTVGIVQRRNVPCVLWRIGCCSASSRATARPTTCSLPPSRLRGSLIYATRATPPEPVEPPRCIRGSRGCELPRRPHGAKNELLRWSDVPPRLGAHGPVRQGARIPGAASIGRSRTHLSSGVHPIQHAWERHHVPQVR
jgi:hypothetical protein